MIFLLLKILHNIQNNVFMTFFKKKILNLFLKIINVQNKFYEANFNFLS